MGAPTINELSALIDDRLPQGAVTSQPEPATAGSVVSTSQPDKVQRSLVPIRAGTTDKPPFFFVHSHGGTVIGYQDVVKRMDPDRAIWGLQSQGIRGDVAPLRTIEQMAACYVAEMIEAYPHGPYLLGGYCMGGTIAWEIAQQLRAAGKEVGLVVMFEAFHRDYPTYPDKANPIMRKVNPLTDWLRAINMRDSGGQARIPFIARTLWSAGLRQAQSGVQIDLESAGGSESLAAVHDANGQSFWLYHPSELDAPVLFISAQHQPKGIIADASLGFGRFARGWSKEVSVAGSYRNGLIGLDLDRAVQEMQACFETVKTSDANADATS